MRVVKRISRLRNLLSDCRGSGKSIGFVPTMGYFHDGHLSLMRRARRETDVVVVSLFVNPIQFGKNEDLSRYPRDIKRDKKLAQAQGVDILFLPEEKEMYKPGYSTFIEVKELDEFLCGASRPGHFRGVATVVAKLFNIVRPDIAYFGQKDIQQALILKRMIRDLDFPIKMKICPIVREADGLAMSSRNIYLSEGERKQAVVLYKSLVMAKGLIKEGRPFPFVKKKMRQLVSAANGRVDYIEIVDYNTLRPAQKRSEKIIIAVAVWFGKARLIDNVIISIKGGRR